MTFKYKPITNIYILTLTVTGYCYLSYMVRLLHMTMFIFIEPIMVTYFHVYNASPIHIMQSISFPLSWAMIEKYINYLRDGEDVKK